MKKAVSIFVIISILCGILVSTISSYAADTPYSGGSGTEDDPYLISSGDDIRKLFQAMKTDPSLWYTKYYYKLTNDIETSYNLYVPTSINSNQWSGYCPWSWYNSVLKTTSFQVADKNLRESGLVTIYHCICGEDGSDRYATEVNFFEVLSNNDKYYNAYFRRYDDSYEEYPDYPRWEYVNEYYWNAAFTGVFDGDGHTIKMKKEGSFFGFLENGAQVKNLTIEGGEDSFVYDIDDTSVIVNCTSIGPQGYNVIGDDDDAVVDGITEDGFGYQITENNEIHLRAYIGNSDTVVIPETINGMPVVSLKGDNFDNIDGIESLYIPDGLISIDSDAFYFIEIGTVYYNGSPSMLDNACKNPKNMWKNLNVVYNYEPIEGFALKDGKNTVSLGEGDTFKLEYEVYPENGKGTFQYSYDQSCISIKNGVMTGVKAGETTVTVTAESGVKYTFTVKVIGATGISVLTPPTKTYYGLRQSLDVDGLKIIKQYNDGSFVELTEYKLSSFNPLQRGIQVINVTGAGFTTSFNVFVSDALVGDADLDGKLTAIDSNILKRSLAGEMQIEEMTDSFFTCDLNGDGKINAMDSALLKRSLAG